MDAAEARDDVRAKIKEIIARVAGLQPARIGDQAVLTADLNLDSLSLLEIAVEVDLAFKLELQDERYQGIDSVPAMVALVEERRRELVAQTEAVGG